MLQTVEIKKVYSFSVNNIWDLTDNIEIAKADKEFTLATLEDLNDMACGGYIIDGQIETTDGIYHWYEETTVDEHGFEDFTCEYRLVQ
ncbi:hypothetical protein [Bacillus weihaiensis]|uniref:hypothetical protein n=1 Tax=Bacillus weihaiensis TaxID=1547283 RepID=UPI002352B04E|nr:hypothetical protein [Bacillus weihaiensis]